MKLNVNNLMVHTMHQTQMQKLYLHIRVYVHTGNQIFFYL
jgi:hypothetical protein